MTENRKIISAEVVPWDVENGTWAISIRYDNGDGHLYRFYGGEKEDAEAEVKTILAGTNKIGGNPDEPPPKSALDDAEKLAIGLKALTEIGEIAVEPGGDLKRALIEAQQIAQEARHKIEGTEPPPKPMLKLVR